MGPAILLDKSGLQAMPERLRPFLSRHYYLVVPPVLVMEVLGDLTKVRQGGVGTLRMLAERILGTEYAFNMDHRDLRMASLLGHPVEMGGRPIVEAREFDTKIGKAALVTETNEYHQLLRWQFEKVSNLDEQAAKEWRSTLASVNLEKARAALKQANPVIPKATTFVELALAVDAILKLADQRVLLRMCLEDAQIGKERSGEIEKRWDDMKGVYLWTFAPYAFFCFRIRMLFHIGLVNGLITTRASNTADLLYLYYVPFCKVFSSNDKLHESLAPLVMRSDQAFIRTTALRGDFEAIACFWDSLSRGEQSLWRNKFGGWPPRNAGSFTYQAWRRTMRLPGGLRPGNVLSRMSPEAKAKMDEKAREVMAVFREITEQINGPPDGN